jgi:hypothetical protein
MKKSFVCMSILLALALVLTLFVGCLAPEEKESIEGAAQEQEWKWYVSKEGGFKLKYPACFELDEIVEKEGFFGWAFDYEWKSNDDPERAALLVCKSDANDKYHRGKSIYEIAKINAEALGMTNAEVSNIALDGKPAVKVVNKVERVLEYGGPTLYDIEVDVTSRSEDWIYSISFCCLLSNEPVPDSWYKEAINSFEFL